MIHKIPRPEGECISWHNARVHVLTSIAFVANTLYCIIVLFLW